jgi:FKBP-type peptidyl-prolyl cis-trans isomerase 2
MTFTADTATYNFIDGAHIAGLAIENGADGYLIFQRSGNKDPDDWGIYFELNDQSNSGYGIIQECRIDRQKLEIDLNKPLAGVICFNVKLLVDDEAYENFMKGMKIIFREHKDKLKIGA